MNMKGSQAVAVGGVIDPDANGAGALTSDYMDAGKFQSLMAIIMMGTMATNSVVDAKLVQATDSSGTGVKDITGKAITQFTAAGTDSDKQAIINVLAEELDVAGGFSFVAIIMTVATAASDSAAVLLGMNPRHGPASDFDLASVDEIV